METTLLADRIIHTLHVLERRRAVVRSTFGMAGCVLAVVLMTMVLPSRGALSDAFAFVRLLWSDARVVGSAWQDFVYSILETVPAMAIAICSGALLVFGWSFRAMLRGSTTLCRSFGVLAQ